MQDADIDCSDIPETTEAQMAWFVLRIGDVPVSRDKQQVNSLLDAFTVECCKCNAGDKDYQALINTMLSDDYRSAEGKG